MFRIPVVTARPPAAVAVAARRPDDVHVVGGRVLDEHDDRPVRRYLQHEKLRG